MAFKQLRKYFGVVMVLLMISSISLAQTDSLGIEKKGDKIFVVHKVLSKQTLFSLAKRYQTTVTEINQANPALANGLQVGQTLKIPFGGTLPTESKPVTLTVTSEQKHKVAAGETLFAIAKQYEVSITDLKQWNNLSSNSLSLGQELLVKVKGQAVLTEEVTKTPSTEVPKEVSEVKNPVSIVKIDTTQKEIAAVPEAENYGGTKLERFELEGLAEVIEEEEPSKKFFALHRTAKEGTVIKVKNLMNGLTVYVRVVGSMPSETDEKVIIKLNQKTYDHLKAIDKRFRVEVSYFQ